MLETITQQCSEVTIMMNGCKDLLDSLTITMSRIVISADDWKCSCEGLYCINKLLTLLQTSQSLLELLQQGSNRKLTSEEKTKWKGRFDSVKRQCSDLQQMTKVSKIPIGNPMPIVPVSAAKHLIFHT